MGFDVNAKNVKLWKNEHEGRRGKFYTYSVSVSKKMQDGTYKHKSIKLFKKGDLPNFENGAVCDIEGFLTLDVYEGRNGETKELALFANRVRFRNNDATEDIEDFAGDDFESLEEDIPF